ncbi:hypothetical protein EV421DRAFT_147722 [Armillaria borealis]|uniref:Uncharacterized protein n=1 Tax=Armillaria borealis TaxID=47425 RepID=A0AA39JRF9_9AGAR|nr:hypothetical protein EV421DRAFT_147722 [Armillaria borealis]
MIIVYCIHLLLHGCFCKGNRVPSASLGISKSVQVGYFIVKVMHPERTRSLTESCSSVDAARPNLGYFSRRVMASPMPSPFDRDSSLHLPRAHTSSSFLWPALSRHGMHHPTMWRMNQQRKFKNWSRWAYHNQLVRATDYETHSEKMMAGGHDGGPR